MNTHAHKIQLFSNLSISVGSHLILDNQTLSLYSGTITVLMGPSGVGKSALADVVFRTQRANSFHVTGRRENIRDIGALVFQEGGTLPYMTVDHNLRLINPNPDAATGLLDPIDFPRQQLASRLSGGQKRRLSAVSGLLAKRHLLWFDEPEVGLDLPRVHELANLLREQASENHCAVLVVTHQIDFALQIADRIVFLDYTGQLTHCPNKSKANVVNTIAELSSLDAPSGDHLPRERRRNTTLPVDCIKILICSLPLLWTLCTRVHSRLTFAHACRLGIIDSAFFYPFIGFIFGGVFLLVLRETLPAAIETSKMVAEIGPTLVIRFSPPMAAILVAACGGSTISSWIGHMNMARQLDSIDVLGARVSQIVLAPAWWGLTLACVFQITSFSAAMTLIFFSYVLGSELQVTVSQLVNQPSYNLLADFWSGFLKSEVLALGGVKTVTYAMLVSSITLGFARAPKQQSTDVASAITKGIIWCSVIVMSIELVILGSSQIP